MTRLTDRAYLLTDQYRDSSNLNSRAQLHKRFSTNRYGWQRWVFDQFQVSSRSRLLELGCGPAWLWVENEKRIPSSWDVILSDFSMGMIKVARQKLAAFSMSFKFGLIDAQAIPFGDGSLDAVIANHMLYHVPNIQLAISEIRRVIKPGGWFYATTNGGDHLFEIRDLVGRADAGLAFEQPQVLAGGEHTFTLENAPDLIARWFSEVRLQRYEDSLMVNDVDSLLEYILSSIGNAREILVGDRLRSFKWHLEGRMKAEGVIHITKDSGMLLAR